MTKNRSWNTGESSRNDVTMVGASFSGLSVIEERRKRAREVARCAYSPKSSVSRGEILTLENPVYTAAHTNPTLARVMHVYRKKENHES